MMRTAAMIMSLLLGGVDATKACMSDRRGENVAIVIARSQQILRVHLMSYQPVALYGDAETSAKIRVEVLGALVGKYTGPRVIYLTWPNPTKIMPKNWTGPANIIVGVRPRVHRENDLAGEIIQQDCAPLDYLEDTSDNRSRLRQLIKSSE